jgi:hypothetical protein
LPATHTMQAADDVEPVLGLYRPAPQLKQLLVAAEAEYRPTLHTMQSVTVS